MMVALPKGPVLLACSESWCQTLLIMEKPKKSRDDSYRERKIRAGMTSKPPHPLEEAIRSIGNKALRQTLNEAELTKKHRKVPHNRNELNGSFCISSLIPMIDIGRQCFL